MKVIILGSGGIESVPKPCCRCHRCQNAVRMKGAHIRTGPSLFVKTANILIDTPEEIRIQLIRENIARVDAIFYTHGHPDHTMGLRIIEQMKKDCHTDKPIGDPIDVYIHEDQLAWMNDHTVNKKMFDFYISQGFMRLHLIKDGDTFTRGGITITAIQFPNSTAFYYLLADGKDKVVYMPCEIGEIREDPRLEHSKYLIVHFSWFREPGICVDFPWKNQEVPFERVMEFAQRLSIPNVVFTHIDECHDKTPDELSLIEKRFGGKGVRFAYDGMQIEC